jgi:hypothetical protein
MAVNIDKKPFDLAKAKEGYKVIDGNGNPARVLVFNRKMPLNKGFCMLALVDKAGNEIAQAFSLDGTALYRNGVEDDLYIAPVKMVGWVNVYEDMKLGNLHSTKEKAQENQRIHVVDTIKIEWSE